MPIHYPEILNAGAPDQLWRWTENDTILYALCLGLGADPLDSGKLRYVLETDLRVMPTLPTVIAWAAEPTFTRLGIDPALALHGEQKIELHRPVPAAWTARISGRVLSVVDKGRDKGAIVVTEQTLADNSTGELVATMTTTCFARGEGGCGGAVARSNPPHPIPVRAPDASLRFPTRPDLALFYRLTGDRNLLHADPAAARAGGFDRPILHGLCSFGMTCRAVLETFGGDDPTRIASHQARFVAPVYPGDTLTVDLWHDAPDVVSFEARVEERGVKVIGNGKATLRS